MLVKRNAKLVIWKDPVFPVMANTPSIEFRIVWGNICFEDDKTSNKVT